MYRAGDGRWYAGIRDFSPAASRFLAAQPVAGPFLRAARGGVRTGFRYFDASGNALVPDGTNERSIARVRVTTLSVVPVRRRRQRAPGFRRRGAGAPGSAVT